MILELMVVGVGVGALSGFFGVGGGTFLIPILLALGFNIKDAIGISILQMVFSSIYGSYLNHKKGSLVLKDGLFIGIGGLLGGYIGGYITPFIPNFILEFTFLGVLFFALLKLFFSTSNNDKPIKKVSNTVFILIGFIIGILSITIGIGGSLILTPILVGFFYYPLKKAISAGLFFVVFSSFAGLLGRVFFYHIDFENGIIVALSSLIGVFFGIWLKEVVNAKKHKIALLILYLISISVLLFKIVT